MENKTKLEPCEKAKGKSKCPICKGDATLVCSGCQSVFYCSVDHQKKHWKLHQSSCVFFHIKDDPSEFTGAGKYCVASRDLKAGTIILEELSVFQMPPNSLDHCITCAIDLPQKRNASNSCPKCNWPVCGTACAQFPLHAAYECRVFEANRIPYPKMIAGLQFPELEVYPLLMRAYAFMMLNPTRWKDLIAMVDWRDIENRSLDDTVGDMFYMDTLRKITSTASRFPNIARGNEGLLVGILPKLIRLLETQGYYIAIQENSNFDSTIPGTDITFVSNVLLRMTSYVYKTARHFVHSCSPNCFWTVGTFPDFKMQIRTSVAVKKGEKLTVSRFIYDVNFANGTRSRQKEFQSRFRLPCRCDLCLDPTEFGTKQSAVICEHCKADGDVNSGFLLPIDPLNIAEDAPWKCNLCMKITTASKFVDKLEEIALDLHKNYSISAVSGGKFCEGVIEMYRNKLVHPNHWLIQLARKLIRTSQLRRIYSMNVEELSAFEKNTYPLLELKDKTVPGIIHERIVVVYYLSLAMCTRLFIPEPLEEFHKEFMKKSSEDLTQILVEVRKCQEYQKESLLFYKHPPNVRRGQTVDCQLSTLRHDMKRIESLRISIHNRLTEIQIQRARFGIN